MLLLVKCPGIFLEVFTFAKEHRAKPIKFIRTLIIKVNVKNKVSVFLFLGVGVIHWFYHFAWTHDILLFLLYSYLFCLPLSKEFSSNRKQSLDTFLSFIHGIFLLFVPSLKEGLKTQESPASDELSSEDQSMLKLRLPAVTPGPLPGTWPAWLGDLAFNDTIIHKIFQSTCLIWQPTVNGRAMFISIWALLWGQLFKHVYPLLKTCTHASIVILHLGNCPSELWLSRVTISE